MIEDNKETYESLIITCENDKYKFQNVQELFVEDGFLNFVCKATKLKYKFNINKIIYYTITGDD